jgi:hypothetical protein
MIKLLPVIGAAALLAAATPAASADTLKLTDAQMDSVTAGFGFADAFADADAFALGGIPTTFSQVFTFTDVGPIIPGRLNYSISKAAAQSSSSSTAFAGPPNSDP